MSSAVNRQWRLVRRPSGPLDASNFEWVAGPVPAPGDGEVLVRTLQLSLDPTYRSWAAGETYVPAVPIGAVMRGIGVGVVDASRSPAFAPGDLVQGMLGWQEWEMTTTATRRAGRPGLGIGCIENSVTEIGELSASEAFGPRHWHHIAMISEFKTNYGLMIKVAHLIKTNSIIHSFYNTIYGGTVGGREGMAIAIVGGCILLQMAYMTKTHSVSPTHPFYGNTTTPDILRAIAPAQQALSRNTHLLNDVVITPVGGPGTKTLLYEVAAQSMVAVASGSAALIGPRSGAGTEPGHISGLEARFMAEVAHATAGMSRADADAIVQRIVALYADDLDKRPFGKRFDEVYDVVRVQPTAEWLAVYEAVKAELRDLGLNLDSAGAYARASTG